jgi:uncharacterized cofD-like protein
MSLSVTVIGGGTGSFHILKGLRGHAGLDIRSIVTMMDSGGDSGRLRDEFGVLPPGDARRCMVALSEESDLVRDLFSYRFQDPPLEGRQFGNLFFLALTKLLGDERGAYDAVGRLLKIRGRVIAVTWDHAHLHAELADGTVVEGEANIGVPQREPAMPIRHVTLRPEARANPEAVRAIEESDVVLFAPGDLYTSTIPNLLVTGIPEALRRSRAAVVYAVNLMTRRTETDGYAASRHAAEIARYGGRMPDAVLAHRGEIPAALLARYEAERSRPVEVDVDALRRLGVKTVHLADVMSRTSLVRHDPARSAAALTELFRELAPGRG